MVSLYTAVAMTGTVATLLNRDAMLQSPATAGDTTLYIGYAYMDPETLTTVVFPTGTSLWVGNETVTVTSVPASTTIGVSALSSDHSLYTPILRLDYFDVSTDFPTLTAPCSIRIGTEDVQVSSIDYATNYYRCYIDSRGSASYPHTEWAPVVDAAFDQYWPATNSDAAAYGIVEDTDYHIGALDQNTLDIYAYDKLMNATNPQTGRVEITGMDVWQVATYRNRKTIQYSVSSATKYATVSFVIHSGSGTDSDTDVYLDDATRLPTWWDLRFATADGMARHYLATFSTVAATVWVRITDPSTTSATLSMYWGNDIAIDYTLAATPTGYSAFSLGSWSARTTGAFDIGDRGIANVREGDLVDVKHLDGSTTSFRISGMIYDQQAGRMTMEIGPPEDHALSDIALPFWTVDAYQNANL